MFDSPLLPLGCSISEVPEQGAVDWLYSRHLQGQGVDAKFLIRVEDTDLDRNQPEHVAVIFEVLNWLGIGADAEPVYQSSLASQHSEAVDQLLAAGHAYRCDCTQEESEARAEGGLAMTAIAVIVE